MPRWKSVLLKRHSFSVWLLILFSCGFFAIGVVFAFAFSYLAPRGENPLEPPPQALAIQFVSAKEIQITNGTPPEFVEFDGYQFALRGSVLDPGDMLWAASGGYYLYEPIAQSGK